MADPSVTSIASAEQFERYAAWGPIRISRKGEAGELWFEVDDDAGYDVSEYRVHWWIGKNDAVEQLARTLAEIDGTFVVVKRVP